MAASDPASRIVLVVHLHGDDYEAAVDAANDAGGSVDAVVAHLAQWDSGSELDSAAVALDSLITLDELRGYRHQLHETVRDGIRYWVLLDHHLRFYALYRALIEREWPGAS